MVQLNNKGIALVTALMLTMITLVIILGVMTLISNNTKSSAANKAYRNVTEAAYGGADLLLQDVIPRLFTNMSSSATATAIGNGILANNMLTDYGSGKISMQFNRNACLQAKLTKIKGPAWAAACGVELPGDQMKSNSNPDMTFKLQGVNGQDFTVYSKIVDTMVGVPYPPNTNQLIGGGVAESSGGTTTNLSHYVYRVEISGERTVNPAEKSNLSILYEY
jgi:hypothetical protein